MEPRKAFLASPFPSTIIFFVLITISLYLEKASSDQDLPPLGVGPVVEKGHRRKIFVSEYGEISAIDVMGGHGAPFHHLEFFTLDPNSLFLPVLLHADMVFYVHTGGGKLSWANENNSGRINLREGDVCQLSVGSVFYIQSNLEPERKKLRIHALFANSDYNTYDPLIGAYSRINNLVKGFDKKILQAAFKVPEDLVESIANQTKTPAIVHAVREEEPNRLWELEASVLRNLIGIPTNTNKVKRYNIYEKNPDFENCHGWSLTVNKKRLKTLKETNIGFFMVNLTQAAMLGPHWNPRGTEIAVVLQGEGMVRVICGSDDDEKKIEECESKRFRVKEGDAFVVPRFHPMAHMSFNNDSLVFIGFSTASRNNYPQFLAGKTSVLRMMDKEVLAVSLGGASNSTIDQLLESQDESIIFGCVSCAEEEERIMEEERRKREEEEKERQEKEEEEEREKEEEERREREAEARKQEEEARREQEEREREREEEELAKREQEEMEKRRKEEKEREEQEEEEAIREKEEAKKRQEKEEREKGGGGGGRKEQEEGRRQWKEWVRRRQHGGDNNNHNSVSTKAKGFFEGRRVFNKIQNF